MIALQDRQLVYEYLLLDLAIRSLQHDIEHMSQLKFADLYSEQLRGILQHLQKDAHWRKNNWPVKKSVF